MLPNAATSLLLHGFERAGLTSYTILPGYRGNQAVGVAYASLPRIPVEAYVIPHFRNLSAQGVIDPVLARPAFQEAFSRYGFFLQQSLKTRGDQPWGDTFVTEVGTDQPRCLIHVVARGCDTQREPGIVSLGSYRALIAARDRRISSITLPLLGTGLMGSLPPDVAMNAMMKGISQFWGENPDIDSMAVFIALFPDHATHPARVRLSLDIG